MAIPQIPNYDECLQVLQQTPLIIRNLVSIATPEQLQWRPNADRWSIAMVLAHLADVETRGFQDRFIPMLYEDRPILKSYDQWEIFRAQTDFDPDAELMRFEGKRSATLSLLRGLDDGAGRRTGQHEEFGVITVAQLMNEFTFHDFGHIRQIMELYRSHALYPHMGPYQSYYRINP